MPEYFHFASEEVDPWLRIIAIAFVYYAGWLLKSSGGTLWFPRKRKDI